MEKVKKIKVHIADDHQVLIDGVVSLLNSEDDIEVVGHSLNGEEVLEWYANKKNTSDVLVLDINMPKVDGIKVLHELKKRRIETQIVVLSSYEDIKLVKEVLKIGAKGYLAKMCAADQIVKAIRAVYNGKQYFSNDIKEEIVAAFSDDDVDDSTTFFNSLTNREKEILALIAKEQSTKEIAANLFISVNTVETHRKNLIRKLKVKNVVGLALYAHKHQII